MRIIAGTFRSRHLLPLKKLKLRPTSDMLRETLFNILGPCVEDARFLDLFAGTGAVGIEAVSRGASFVVFAENHHAAARLITENLASLTITTNIRIMKSDALEAVHKLEAEQQRPFNLIFLDPPYASERDYHAILHALAKSSLLAAETMVIAEHRKTFDLPESVAIPESAARELREPRRGLQRYRVLRQGPAALSFFSPF
jgi:16S rRNA (guanine(966)-N(2))-methyltransferase RsmD